MYIKVANNLLQLPFWRLSFDKQLDNIAPSSSRGTGEDPMWRATAMFAAQWIMDGRNEPLGMLS